MFAVDGLDVVADEALVVGDPLQDLAQVPLRFVSPVGRPVAAEVVREAPLQRRQQLLDAARRPHEPGQWTPAGSPVRAPRRVLVAEWP